MTILTYPSPYKEIIILSYFENVTLCLQYNHLYLKIYKAAELQNCETLSFFIASMFAYDFPTTQLITRLGRLTLATGQALANFVSGQC